MSPISRTRPHRLKMTTSAANVQGAQEALPLYKHHLKYWTTLLNCDSLTSVYRPEACAGALIGQKLWCTGPRCAPRLSCVLTTSLHALESLNSHRVCCCYCATCAQLVMLFSFMPHPAATQTDAAEHSLAEQQQSVPRKASQLCNGTSHQQTSAVRALSKARSTTLGPQRKTKPPHAKAAD